MRQILPWLSVPPETPEKGLHDAGPGTPPAKAADFCVVEEIAKAAVGVFGNCRALPFVIS